MKRYKIYSKNWAIIKAFESLQDAEAWRDVNKPGLLIEDLGTVPTKTDEEKLSEDQDFLQSLISTIKLDIRKINNKATRLNVINKLKSAKETMDFGDVENVRDFIDSVSIGAVFTQAVKDKYLGLIDSYLNSI